MSSNTYRSQLQRLQAEKAKLESDLAKERSALAKAQKEASQLHADIIKTKSESTRKSKQRQLSSKQDQIAKTQKKIGDIEKKIAQKLTDINDKTKQLAKAEASETKKQQQAELQHLEDINAEIDQQIQLENTRQATKLLAGREGKLKLSDDARKAAQQLLDMFTSGELEKESRLIRFATFGGENVRLYQPDGGIIEFNVPIPDIKELAAYGVLSLQETRSKGRVSGWNILLLPERLKEVVTDKVMPDAFRVFYSWQSWTPVNANRHFILQALEKATKEIRDDETIEVEPVVDRDTIGVAGSVDIAATIFRKIAESQIFVCDATIITDSGSEHSAPNPNVMLELGYAAAVLGWENIICVVNTAFGSVEQMPFDLRPRRLLPYHLPTDVTDKADVRKRLTKDLRGAVEVIVEQYQSDMPTDDKVNPFELDEALPDL